MIKDSEWSPKPAVRPIDPCVRELNFFDSNKNSIQGLKAFLTKPAGFLTELYIYLRTLTP